MQIVSCLDAYLAGFPRAVSHTHKHRSSEIKSDVDYVYKGDTYPSWAFILLTVRMLMRPEDFFPPKTTTFNIQLSNLFLLFCRLNHYKSPTAATEGISKWASMCFSAAVAINEAGKYSQEWMDHGSVLWAVQKPGASHQKHRHHGRGICATTVSYSMNPWTENMTSSALYLEEN